MSEAAKRIRQSRRLLMRHSLRDFGWRLGGSCLGWVAVAAPLLSLAGCGPAPPKPEELGRVVFDPLEMPFGPKRFKLPELKEQPPSPEPPPGYHPDHPGHADEQAAPKGE
jgi:hypothetical protein